MKVNITGRHWRSSKLVYLEVPSLLLLGPRNSPDYTSYCELPVTLQGLRECNKTTLEGLEYLLQSTHHIKSITLYFDELPSPNTRCKLCRDTQDIARQPRGAKYQERTLWTDDGIDAE